MRIAVVGAGNGGCAMAAALAKRGHEVSLLKLGNEVHAQNFNLLKERGTIRLEGIEGSGEYPLKSVTRDPGEALAEAEIAFVYYVANYHPFVAERCAPYLHASQMIVLSPGYVGSLLIEKEMKRIGNSSKPVFAEFETLPYSSRLTSPGVVRIMSRNVRHPFATYPCSRARELQERIGPVIGECVPRRHLLEVSLHNPNLIIHTIGVLMNASRVEDPAKTFALYRDGFSPSVWRVVEALDNEKMNALEKIGAPRIPYFDEFRLRTFTDVGIDPLEGFHRYAGEAPDGPFEVSHRYVTEDVPMGLGLLQSIGRCTGVPTPICDSLVSLASAMMDGRDLQKEVRTIAPVWEGSIEQLLDALTQ